MENIDRKVQSVRRVEDFNEKKKYYTNKQIFRGYMKNLSDKKDKALLKVGKFMVPFSMGSIAVAASGSFLGVVNHEMTMQEAVALVGKVGALEAGLAVGLVLSTIAAIDAKAAISFTYDYMSYPRNKETLQKLGLYHKVLDKKEILESEEMEETSKQKGASK